MTDIALTQQEDGSYDIDVAGADLEADDGLETAITLSLFLDRRANPDDVLPDPQSDDRRGWWADAFPDVPRDLMGSRLWLLERSKQIPSVLAHAQEYAAEALQWLVDDGIAASLTVVATFTATGQIQLSVGLIRPDGTPLGFKYDTTWQAQLNAV